MNDDKDAQNGGDVYDDSQRSKIRGKDYSRHARDVTHAQCEWGQSVRLAVMLTRPHMSRPRPRPRLNIIDTQCPRDRTDKVLCDTSCFVNEYLIPDYSLLKLDFSSYTQ